MEYGGGRMKKDYQREINRYLDILKKEYERQSTADHLLWLMLKSINSHEVLRWAHIVCANTECVFSIVGEGEHNDTPRA